MRLQRLEIAGFKSFPDRSELTFDTRRDRHRRAQRLRQEQRRRCDHLGARRAERQEPARRSHGGRDLRRQRRAQADGRGGSAAAARRRRRRACPATAMPVRSASRRTQRGRHAGRGELLVGRRRSRSLEEPPLIVRDVELMRRLYRSGESEYLIDGEVVPAAGRAGPADGRRPRHQGVRGHRAGEDRPDPQRAADRSPAADRGGGRRHEVQEPAPRRGAEARGRAAEPDARRRHRLRGREAARRAEAAGGEGAALPAAARRAAALGEGAVRAALPRCSARRSRRPARRLADARARETARRRARRRSRGDARSGCGSS